MKRIGELIEAILKKYSEDDFFIGFWESIEHNTSKLKSYTLLNEYLCNLDDYSWELLQEKAITKFKSERFGNRKQHFFDILNEAKGYSFLLKNNFTSIEFIPEDNKSPTPDIKSFLDTTPIYCEVKSINISDDQIARRKEPGIIKPYEIYGELSDGFIKKIRDNINNANSQVWQYAGHNAISLVYMIINFDDFTGDYVKNYEKTIKALLETDFPNDNVYIHNFHYQRQIDIKKLLKRKEPERVGKRE